MRAGPPAVPGGRRLQVFKATADFAGGAAFYARYTDVPDSWLPLRALVVSQRKPRQLFVQPCLELAGSAAPAPGGGDPDACSTVIRGTAQAAVQLRTFPASLEGLLASFVCRWPKHDPELLGLWEAERGAHVLESTGGGTGPVV
jgi:hypothetical protein